MKNDITPEQQKAVDSAFAEQMSILDTMFFETQNKLIAIGLTPCATVSYAVSTLTYAAARQAHQFDLVHNQDANRAKFLEAAKDVYDQAGIPFGVFASSEEEG